MTQVSVAENRTALCDVTRLPARGGGAFHTEFLVTLGGIPGGQQTGGVLDADGLHQNAFLTVG